MGFIGLFNRFLSFEAVSVRTVAITALISYLLQINAIISGEPFIPNSLLHTITLDTNRSL